MYQIGTFISTRFGDTITSGKNTDQKKTQSFCDQ